MVEERYFLTRRTSALAYFLISAVFHFTMGTPQFHVITESKSFSNARMFCKNEFTDLATIHNFDDMDTVTVLVSKTGNNIDNFWIGLKMDAEWSSHWSQPDHKQDFSNLQEAQSPGQECAAMNQEGKWFWDDCSNKHKSVCHGNGNGNYNIVDQAKSWRDAQSHCRNLLSDLVSIHSEEENSAVHNRTSAHTTVWIGLFRDQWKWSDGSNSSFRLWKNNEPSKSKKQDCVVAAFKTEKQWITKDCQMAFAFICQGELMSTTTTTQSQTTNRSIAQLPTSLTTSLPTQMFHLNVSATTQMNFTNITSSATIVNKLSPSTSATHISPLPTVTKTQHISSATDDTASDKVPSSTTEIRTVAQTTTRPSTLMPTTSWETVKSANFVLVKKNLTWIDAMAYCREHYGGLVVITCKDVQDKVAEMVKNATSRSVWLSLRYACTFKFWFWTGATSNCYQNWKLGEGPGSEYGCGVSGAMEATGRQQWTGLSERETLNFICHT